MSQDHAPTSADPLPHTTRQKILGPLQFVLRGLAISLPSVLTVVILIWILRGVNSYIIFPATTAMKWVLAQNLDRSVETEPLLKLSGGPELEGCGLNYLVTADLRKNYSRQLASLPPGTLDSKQELGDWLATRNGLYVPFGRRSVPYQHYLVIARELHPNDMPRSSTGLYMEYAAEKSFGSLFPMSLVAVILILVILYFLGRLVTARVGHWVVSRFESGVLGRLPVVRNVYGSVKQVTDFLFSESQVEYRRVVAIEYPRRGIWSLGLVTGDSMIDITTAVGEPCVTVLIPSSPMPVTGYTMSLPRSHVLDLNITVEHAMNFCISCGVLVPPHQRVTPELLRQHLEKRLAEGFQTSGATRSRPAGDRSGDSGPVAYRPSDDVGDGNQEGG
ncbi:MAG: DUF502 domain-containing protein [Planctomycetaceae bacterium]